MNKLQWFHILTVSVISSSSSEGKDTKAGIKTEHEVERKDEGSIAKTSKNSFDLTQTTTLHPASLPEPVEKDQRTDSTFRKYIQSKNHYVDKTLFIADVMNYTGVSDVIAISRPRCCGKTINLDMIADFCSIGTNARSFFNASWNIMQNDYEPLRSAYMNTYPVVYLNLINMQHKKTYDSAMFTFNHMIQVLFLKYDYLAHSHKLNRYQKRVYKEVTEDKITDYNSMALGKLCDMLTTHHGKKPFLIIDEVDAPLAAAVSSRYYEAMFEFMEDFLSTSLKGNRAFTKAIVAGVTPLEGYVPNNSDVYTIFDCEFDSFFGFTRGEVMELLRLDKKEHLIDEITRYYKNYRVENQDIYNPYSIIKCRSKNWKIQRYATSRRSLQALTENLFNDFGLLPPLNFQILMTNETLKKKVHENFNLKNLLRSQDSMWAYFLHSGVVTTDELPSVENNGEVLLRLPGEDIREMLRVDVISQVAGLPNYTHFINDVDNGHFDAVEMTLEEYVLNAGIFLTRNIVTEYDQRQQLREYVELLIHRWLPGDEKKRENHYVKVDREVCIVFLGKEKKGYQRAYGFCVGRFKNSTEPSEDTEISTASNLNPRSTFSSAVGMVKGSAKVVYRALGSIGILSVISSPFTDLKKTKIFEEWKIEVRSILSNFLE